MLKQIIVCFIIFFSLISKSSQAQTQHQQIDERVSELLQELKFQYEVKNDGSFQFTVPLGNRSQMIFVHSQTSTYNKLEIREVYSVIYQGNKKPEDSILNKLMIDNSIKKLGAWEMIREEDSYFLVFTAKVIAFQTADDMKSIIDIVATSSDTMEQLIFLTDEW